jgi:prepilin-type N-terminal cleavage/methylation domain-containing protein
MKKRLSRGMTLFELLIVSAIFVVTLVPLLLTYRSYRTTQALAASAEAVANHTREAHIFSREARDRREWGIRSINASLYTLFSSGLEGTRDEERHALESGVEFADSFEILFTIGTGEALDDSVIELVNINGKETLVKISKFGVVEVSQ